MLLGHRRNEKLKKFIFLKFMYVVKIIEKASQQINSNSVIMWWSYQRFLYYPSVNNIYVLLCIKEGLNYVIILKKIQTNRRKNSKMNPKVTQIKQWSRLSYCFLCLFLSFYSRINILTWLVPVSFWPDPLVPDIFLAFQRSKMSRLLLISGHRSDISLSFKVLCFLSTGEKLF